jgi:hypothetical protein
MKVKIRRQWNDWRIAEADLSDISNLHWDNVSGGVYARCPRNFIHGYISCDSYIGDLPHSCAHGKGPHSIKVCIVKKDNDKEVFAAIRYNLRYN